MAASNWKKKAELESCVESARRKLRFARTAKTKASRERAMEMVSVLMDRARQLKNSIEASRFYIRNN